MLGLAEGPVIGTLFAGDVDVTCFVNNVRGGMSKDSGMMDLMDLMNFEL